MENEVKNQVQPNAMEKNEGPSRRTFLTGTGGAALAVAATSLLGNRGVSQTSEASSAGRATEKPTAMFTSTVGKADRSGPFQGFFDPCRCHGQTQHPSADRVENSIRDDCAHTDDRRLAAT